MRRSELVIVPSFSPQPAAGKTRSAYGMASDLLEMSCTTTNLAFFSAASILRASGMLTMGLVQMIHRAFIEPSSIPLNTWVAVFPGLAEIPSTPQKLATSSRCSGTLRLRWQASKVAMPPTSRPPMALGCPVRLNGPEPGLPICPVIRFRSMRARFLFTPSAL